MAWDHSLGTRVIPSIGERVGNLHSAPLAQGDAMWQRAATRCLARMLHPC
jgi:hypothetical protein